MDVSEITQAVDEAMDHGNPVAIRHAAQRLMDLGDPETTGWAHHAIAWACYLENDPNASVTHQKMALELFLERGNSKGISKCYGHLASFYVELGRPKEALEAAHRNLATDWVQKVPLSKANTTKTMGVIYLYCSDYVQALSYLFNALQIYIEIGDVELQANAYQNISMVYLDLGDYQRALEYADRGILLHKQSGNEQAVARAVADRASILMSMGDHQQALTDLASVYDAVTSQHNTLYVVFIQLQRIECLLYIGRLDEASALLDECETLILDHVILQEIYLKNRAHLAELRNDDEQAVHWRTRLLEHATDHQRHGTIATCHLHLRDLARRRGDFDAYVTHNEAYTAISEEISGKETAQQVALMEAERKMSEERQTHAKHLELLRSTLPPTIIERMSRGEHIHDQFEHAAVVFIDIVGFTTHSASMPPDAVKDLLENIFSTFDRICQEHSVMKIKTIGDSYLCFKGDAKAEENVRAVTNVAVRMHDARFMWPGGSPVAFRIGMHLGAVTAGIIGTDRLQYDIWGDTVNMASRLESTCEPGKIQVSKEVASALSQGQQSRGQQDPGQLGQDQGEVAHGTWHLAHGTWHVARRGDIELKGKGTVTTYWLFS